MEDRGRKVKALDAKPVILEALKPVWNAWLQLHNQRQSGFNTNPISKEAIRIQLEDDGYRDPAIREFVRRLIVKIENRWLELFMDDAEKTKRNKGRRRGKRT